MYIYNLEIAYHKFAQHIFILVMVAINSLECLKTFYNQNYRIILTSMIDFKTKISTNAYMNVH